MTSGAFEQFYNCTGGEPRIVGHRGVRGPDLPTENTMLAFARAREEAADGIELDVRLSRDGVVMVAHDVDLARITNGEDTRQVDALGAAELGQVKLAQGGAIPTLEEVLAWAVDEEMVVNVEIKRDVPARAALVRATAAAIGRSGAKVVVSSFDPFMLGLLGSLTALASRRPVVPRALLIHAEQGTRGTLVALALPRTYVDAIHFESTMVTPRVAALAKKRDLPLAVWTVNDPSEARRVASLGVRAIISDRPGLIRSAIPFTPPARS
jgi:glycerophosphoryl diester phosphodiesterase